MAHFEPRGRLAPHTRRQVVALAEAFDDVVVVSTADLDEVARRFLTAHARLVERDNTGYDFLSYRVGLETAGVRADPTAYDEVVVCNDSYVGPLRPYAEVLAEMGARADARGAGFWGLTETDRIAHHVQSFFVAFRAPVLTSPAFAAFWDGVEVLPDRSRVIRRYEVGLSRHLYRAGLTSAAYVQEDEAARRLARRRVAWWALGRTGVPRGRAEAALLRQRTRVPWNPSIALADLAAMPYVKIDTLRYDPYGLGADRLLELAERRHPDAFDGVRRHLADTAGFYPPRPHEVLRPLPAVVRPLRRLVEYGRG